MKTITSNELKQKLENENSTLKLVNALESSKFELMHIPDSLNLTQKVDIKKQLKKDDDIVVYCTNEVCYKSRVLYSILKNMGYDNVKRFSGGLSEWDSKGLPMEGKMTMKAA